MGNICNVEPLQAQGTVVVDSAQSISSENPLQNKVVTVEKANASALCVDLTGNPITFNADSQAVQKLVVTLEPIQEGSGTPSPDNVRPISGRTETGVVANGKNLFDNSKLVQGTKTDSTNGTRCGTRGYWGLQLKEGDVVTYTSSSYNIYCSLEIIDENYNSLQDSGWITQQRSITITASGYVYFGFKKADNSNITPSDVKALNIQLERGSTATPYEPYKTPVSCSMSFGQTVYGGTVDFKTGKVAITHKRVDMGSLNWYYNTSPVDYFVANSVDKKVGLDNIIASIYSTSDASNIQGQPLFSIRGSVSNAYIYVKDSRYTSASDYKTGVTGETICYELATPVELTLTPTELQLLKGYNYITADGNMNISLVPENVIDYVMGQIISAMGTDESGRTTASRAYSAKEYFYKDGKMYKCLTSIASGATFTVGTNCTQTTIFAELTALNA